MGVLENVLWMVPEVLKLSEGLPIRSHPISNIGIQLFGSASDEFIARQFGLAEVSSHTEGKKSDFTKR